MAGDVSVTTITAIITDKGYLVEISGSPEECPFCLKSINALLVYGHIVNESTLEVLAVCPSKSCNKSFIGYYFCPNVTSGYKFSGLTTLGTLERKTFNDVISTISNDFVEIYNQAYQADQHNLTDICGVGYRKALEFLIKDYIINNRPEDKAKVEKKQLGPCITEYVDDSKIKSVASRAVWLGNDETHYVRRWEGKDLNDLKKLIDLTIHWIEAEVTTKSFEKEMPG